MVNDEINETSAPAVELSSEETETSAPSPTSEETESQTSELSTEAQVEEPQQHTGPHLQQTDHRVELAWYYTQRFGFHALLWLQAFWNFLTFLGSTTQTVSRSVLRGIQSQTYVFFKDSNYPYRLQDYTVAGPGIAPVEWYYDADNKLFISSQLYNSTTEYNKRHLEWLSAEIRYKNLMLYDISEFVQQTKWAGEHAPNIERILASWSLHSGIVLNILQDVSIHTINEDGTESNLAIGSRG